MNKPKMILSKKLLNLWKVSFYNAKTFREYLQRVKESLQLLGYKTNKLTNSRKLERFLTKKGIINKTGEKI